MSRRKKRERELERYRRKAKRDPAGEVAKFIGEMVRRNYVTQHEVDACVRRMDNASTDEERAEIQRDFLLRIKQRVESEVQA